MAARMMKGFGRRGPAAAAAPTATGPQTRTGPTPRWDLLLMALAVCILTYVWRMQDLYGIFASLKTPALASVGAMALYVADTDRRRSLKGVASTLLFRLLGGIAILAVLSIFVSVHDGMSFNFVMNDFSKNFIVMTLIGASVRSFVDVERFAQVVLLGGFVYAFYVYRNVEVGMSGRLGDLAYYDANDLGMLLVCTLPIALYFLLRGRKKAWQGVALACLGLFVLVIIKTGSRGAFLGMVAMGIYFLFRFNALSRKTRILAVVGGVAALMIVGSEQYWAMMATLLNPQEDYNWAGESDSGRMEVWKRGLGYMLSHPFLGVGVAAYPVAEGVLSPIAARQAIGVGVKWGAAHNSFVQVGAEIGVIGLILFCRLIWTAYSTARTAAEPPRPLRRTPDEQVLGQALAGAVVGYLVCGFFLSQAYSAYMFTLYGMIIGLARVGSQMPRGAPAPPPPRRPPPRRPVARQPAMPVGPLALPGPPPAG